MSELAVREVDECLLCGTTPVRVAYRQDPLLIHGGYGEAVRTTLLDCGCRIRVVTVESENPRR